MKLESIVYNAENRKLTLVFSEAQLQDLEESVDHRKTLPLGCQLLILETGKYCPDCGEFKLHSEFEERWQPDTPCNACSPPTENAEDSEDEATSEKEREAG